MLYLKEYNCLMRHIRTGEIETWYWTDGNDVADTGVWTHAVDDSEARRCMKERAN